MLFTVKFSPTLLKKAIHLFFLVVIAVNSAGDLKKCRRINYWVTEVCGVVKEAEVRERDVSEGWCSARVFLVQVTESPVLTNVEIR